MRKRWLAPAFVATCAALACAEAIVEPAPREPDVPNMTGPVTLLAPDTGFLILQNDPAIACPAHAARGRGFRLNFDWEDVPGAYRYAIHLKRTGALYPAIDLAVMESKYDAAWCNAFVTDANLLGWVWRVAAIADDSTGGADTLWSDVRAYGFYPCRHADMTPCTAPPGP